MTFGSSHSSATIYCHKGNGVVCKNSVLLFSVLCSVSVERSILYRTLFVYSIKHLQQNGTPCMGPPTDFLVKL